MRSKIKKNINPRILFRIGIVLLMCYFGGIFYFYNIQEYNPYASAGADLDALIHSVLFLTPTAICLILSLILHIKAKKWIALSIASIYTRLQIPIYRFEPMNNIFDNTIFWWVYENVTKSARLIRCGRMASVQCLISWLKRQKRTRSWMRLRLVLQISMQP